MASIKQWTRAKVWEAFPCFCGWAYGTSGPTATTSVTENPVEAKLCAHNVHWALPAWQLKLTSGGDLKSCDQQSHGGGKPLQ